MNRGQTCNKKPYAERNDPINTAYYEYIKTNVAWQPVTTGCVEYKSPLIAECCKKLLYAHEIMLHEIKLDHATVNQIYL